MQKDGILLGTQQVHVLRGITPELSKYMFL